MQNPEAIEQAAAQTGPTIVTMLAATVLLVVCIAFLAWLAFAGWMLLRIVYRAAYPPEPKKCPHCGKPLL